MKHAWCLQYTDLETGESLWAVYQRKEHIPDGIDGLNPVGDPYKVNADPEWLYHEMWGELQEDTLPPPPYKAVGVEREREALLCAAYLMKLEADENSRLLPEGDAARKAFYEGQKSACEIIAGLIMRGAHLEILDAQNPDHN